MKAKKIPLRKCIGCNEMKPKRELLRVVRNKEGEIKLDKTGKAPGRGTYICKKKECFKKVKKSKGLNKAFQCDVHEEIYQNLIKEIDHCEESD